MKSLLNKILCTLFVFALLCSCRYSEQDKTYTYSNDWTIDYPSFFRKSKHVYPGSELQLANGYRDTYIFVREMITSADLDNVADSMQAALFETLDDPKMESDTSIYLGGATFKTLEITGLLNDKRMYYLMAFIQSGEQIYQFTGWMFNNKRELWEEDYKRMLFSWRRVLPA